MLPPGAKSTTLPEYRTAAERFAALARELGFDLCGVASAGEIPEYRFFSAWVEQGMAGEMKYLTDHRARLRSDARHLLPSARSVLCVGKVYRTHAPGPPRGHGRISAYAWGSDYHEWMHERLEKLVAHLTVEFGHFEHKVCVDTAPLLERAVAQAAGLGWIGKNTCLINQEIGSWFFLGEILTSLDIPTGSPPADRCGACTRCIEACPTGALVPAGDVPAGDAPAYALDSRRCISYLTIELRGAIPEELRPAIGDHLFGCDICQDVCPWNSKSPLTEEAAFQPRHDSPNLAAAAFLTPEEFQATYRHSPVWRAKHRGFLRNAAVALGNQQNPDNRAALDRLAENPDATVREHALWALSRLPSS